MPGRRARHGARDAEGEAAEVGRVQAVDVLVGVDGHQDGVEVDLRRRRVLDEHGVDGRIVVEPLHRVDGLLGGASAGRWTLGLVQPSSAALRIFMPT